MLEVEQGEGVCIIPGVLPDNLPVPTGRELGELGTFLQVGRASGKNIYMTLKDLPESIEK